MSALCFLCEHCKGNAQRIMATRSSKPQSFCCSHNKVRVQVHARGCRWEFEEGLIQTSPIHVMPKRSIHE